MTIDQEEKEPSFKVIDRRRFTEDGQEKSHAAEPAPPKEKASTKSEREKRVQEKTRPDITFSLFIQSLGHQAMMGLGMTAWPNSGLIKKDLGLAKETIDILQILKNKSAGNLTVEEQRLLDTLVYQLQVAYVEISRDPSPEPGSVIIK